MSGAPTASSANHHRSAVCAPRATIGPDDAGRRRRVELGGTRTAETGGERATARSLAGQNFELPTWNGNEFLLADGRRPAPNLHPVHLDGHELTIDIVRHRGGAIADWSETASPGDPCAISGPGRGETIDESTDRYVLATRLPSTIEQLLGVIGIDAVDVISRSSIPTLAWCCPTTHPPP